MLGQWPLSAPWGGGSRLCFSGTVRVPSVLELHCLFCSDPLSLNSLSFPYPPSPRNKDRAGFLRSPHWLHDKTSKFLNFAPRGWLHGREIWESQEAGDCLAGGLGVELSMPGQTALSAASQIPMCTLARRVGKVARRLLLYKGNSDLVNWDYGGTEWGRIRAELPLTRPGSPRGRRRCLGTLVQIGLNLWNSNQSGPPLGGGGQRERVRGKDSLSRNGEMDRERRWAILRVKKREMAMVVALKEGATIVRGYFAKILLLLPPNLARSQAAWVSLWS